LKSYFVSRGVWILLILSVYDIPWYSTSSRLTNKLVPVTATYTINRKKIYCESKKRLSAQKYIRYFKKNGFTFFWKKISLIIYIKNPL